MSEPPTLTQSELDRAAVLAEAGFLEMGRNLESAVSILDRLNTRFARYIAELTDESLNKTHRDLAVAGDNIAALAEARRADANALGDLAEIVAAAGRSVAALQPITAEVGTLSLSARVVAGGMGLAAADFIAFAGDIRKAAQHARTSLTEAGAALGHLDRELTAAHAETDAFNQRHGQAMSALPARLARNLRDLEAQQQLAGDAANAVRQQAEDIRRQVANQIVALQVGDITRQRLEHVATAERLLSRPSRAAGALLAAQLLDTVDELAREGGRIETGLHELARAAHTVNELGVQARGETGYGSLIAALEADMSATASLFSELRAGDPANDQRIAALLAAAGDLASRLIRVQSVQEDIRIMGLNASLKCGRLGAIGRPLAAVAQELRLCSGRFGVSAASVLRDLDRLRSVAAALRDPTRHDRHQEFARATDELLVSLRRMRKLEQDLAAALADVRDDVVSVGRLVDTALEQFGVRHTLMATLRDAAAGFAAWPDSGPCPRETFDRIAAGYTMARERDVHGRFAPLPRQEADDAEDFLF